MSDKAELERRLVQHANAYRTCNRDYANNPDDPNFAAVSESARMHLHFSALALADAIRDEP